MRVPMSKLGSVSKMSLDFEIVRRITYDCSKGQKSFEHRQ